MREGVPERGVVHDHRDREPELWDPRQGRRRLHRRASVPERLDAIPHLSIGADAPLISEPSRRHVYLRRQQLAHRRLGEHAGAAAADTAVEQKLPEACEICGRGSEGGPARAHAARERPVLRDHRSVHSRLVTDSNVAVRQLLSKSYRLGEPCGFEDQ